MDRLDRHLFEQAAFPFTWECGTRFADLDPLGHINNVAMAEILEDARVRFTTGMLRETGRISQRLLVAGNIVNYAAEGHYPAPAQIGTGVISIGRTSFTIRQIARQADLTVALAQCIIVATEEHGPAPIAPALVSALERRLIIQNNSA